MIKNYVSSEIGTLRKILIHRPDEGIGKIPPSKFKEWLYEDTVQLSKMQEEYDEYVLLLLHFIDPDKAKYLYKFRSKHKGKKQKEAYKPSKANYFNSDKVIDVQKALSDILEKKLVRIRLISAICAIENCTQEIQSQLEKLKPLVLSKTLITGVLKKGKVENLIFAPSPNLVFTRDIGIMIKDYILLSKSATKARRRESLIAKYIALFHKNLFKKSPKKIIEIAEDNGFFHCDPTSQQEKIITIEGGDIMMIAKNHLLVGCSERTSKSAGDAIIHKIFSIKSLGIEKISIVKIPAVRAQMHIDTIFTQIKKNAWVLYGGYSKKLKKEQLKAKTDYTTLLMDENQSPSSNKVSVIQFYKEKSKIYQANEDYFSKELNGIEDLLISISIEDFGVNESDVKIIYSGNNQFPYDDREQWTDSCNLLALKDGVVIGYDRNEKTIGAFKDPINGLGFNVITAKKLLNSLAKGGNIHELKDTLILLSSSELSRARGGSHCMSMPLNRDEVK